MVTGVYRYQRIDVFTDRPFCGNPLAVFTRAEGLDADSMQRIARELHLSETTFVFPSGDQGFDYDVRIFSPLAELPTAGAPSLGTVFALAREEKNRADGRFVLQQKDGPVSVTMVAPMMTMKQPCPQVLDPVEEADAVVAMLCLNRADLIPGLLPRRVDCLNPYTVVPLANRAALRSVEFRMDIWRRTLARGSAPTVVAFTTDVRPPHVARVRVFAPAFGIHEDPATAPACGAVAAYMVQAGLLSAEEAKQVVISQGVEMGRPSDVHVMLNCEGNQPMSLRIGGTCVWTGQGEIHVAELELKSSLGHPMVVRRPS